MALDLLLVSSSRCHSFGYLDHCAEAMQELFNATDEILFVPSARPGGMSHDENTKIARDRFALFDIAVRGLHEFDDPVAAVSAARGIFVGGGNSFVLLQALYQQNLISVLRERLQAGLPYMGTSAGSNIVGLTIGTSNDMPIVQPQSLEALGVVSFNINPHYPAVAQDPKHRGETRDDRIREFHFFNSQPVVALYEDGMLRISGPTVRLGGQRNGLVFLAGQAEPINVSPGETLSGIID